MPEPITTTSISCFVASKVFSNLTGKTIDFVFKQFNKTEYEKYEKYINPTFYRTFKNTSKRFLSTSEDGKEKEIFEGLSNLDDIGLSVYFGVNDINIVTIPDDFTEILSTKLILVIKMGYDFDFDKERASLWSNIFKEEYESTIFESY